MITVSKLKPRSIRTGTSIGGKEISTTIYV
ncbi:hypothetical protein [Klebsiella phage vB_KpnM-VAC36]|nr:hypothetical protein [Klebsiella phage vB_KpnM-VAC36]WLJ70005.1 hypothetical protein BM7_CDS0076 [Klebsiella phage Kpn BM7]